MMMTAEGRTTNRTLSFAIYIGLALLVAWAGTHLLNYSTDTRLFKDFLAPWQNALTAYRAAGGGWPQFGGGDHDQYMEKLVGLLRQHDIALPASNTNRRFVYALRKIGLKRKPDYLFILCFPERMIVYGMPPETFFRMDRFIDEHMDPNSGQFRGKTASDGKTYTGIWRL